MAWPHPVSLDAMPHHAPARARNRTYSPRRRGWRTVGAGGSTRDRIFISIPRHSSGTLSGTLAPVAARLPVTTAASRHRVGRGSDDGAAGGVARWRADASTVKVGRKRDWGRADCRQPVAPCSRELPASPQVWRGLWTCEGGGFVISLCATAWHLRTCLALTAACPSTATTNSSPSQLSFMTALDSSLPGPIPNRPSYSKLRQGMQQVV